MQDARSVLQRTGWVMLGVGIADLGYMIYSIISQIQHGAKAFGYNSPFFIWTIIAGILILQNRLTATRIISQILALMIGSTIVQVFTTPFVQPFDLWLISLKLYPQSVLTAFVLSLGALAIEVWIYLQLTSLPVRTAMDEANVNYVSFWRRPSNGLWVGACFALIGFLLAFGFLLKSPTSQKAKERAAEQIGSGYKFHVIGLREHYDSDGHSVQANVVAYNEKEIKNIPLEWKEKGSSREKDGTQKRYYPNGKIDMERTFKNEKLDGVAKDYFESGQLKSEVNYKDGEQEGLTKTYYENGQLNTEENFKDGQSDGLVKVYSQGGQLRVEKTFQRGELEGLAKDYYENGNLRSEVFFKKGKKDGVQKWYRLDGKLEGENSYKNDVLDGPTREYDENGQLKGENIYKDGKIVKPA